jgi:sugar-specific transcriptional regulator TrmB
MSLSKPRQFFLGSGTPHALEAYRGFVAAQALEPEKYEAMHREAVVGQIHQQVDARIRAMLSSLTAGLLALGAGNAAQQG